MNASVARTTAEAVVGLSRTAPVGRRFCPPYPDALFDRIVDSVPDDACSLAADLGAGTGASALPLLRWFDRVVAVEHDPRMAARIPVHPGRLDVLCCRGEQAGFLDGSVGLVVLGNALHLMDAAVLMPRVSAWLRPGGVVAAFHDAFFEGPEPVQRILDHERRHRWEPYIPAVLRDELHTARAVGMGGCLGVRSVQHVRNAVPLTAAELVGVLVSTPYCHAYMQTLAAPEAYALTLEAELARAWPDATIPIDFGIALLLATRHHR
jgi:SAM-dependent methyltransferase